MKDFYSTYIRIYPDDLHIKHEFRYYRSKYRIMCAILSYISTSEKKQFTIADIGGGYGYDDKLLIELLKKDHANIEVQVDVIDPTIDFYNTVHHLDQSDITKQQSIRYIEQSLLDLPIEQYTGKYDIVICCEVIEHLRTSEQEVFFSHFNRLLKEDGIVALTVPNGSSIIKQAAALYTRKRQQNYLFEAEFNYRYSHIGVPTLFQVLGLFSRKEFSVSQIYPTSCLSSTKISRRKRATQWFFDLWIYINLFFSTDLVYIARKKQEIDETVWHNIKQVTLDTNLSLSPHTLVKP